MATRCNIILKDSIADSKVYLYRHWDGYPAETGGDLVKHLVAALGSKNGHMRGFRAMLTSLIGCKRGGEGHDADKAQYEVTDAVHGDIDHLYELSFNAGRANGNTSVLITHSERRMGEWGAKVHLTLAEFVGLVNADRVAINKRIAKLRTESKHYADCDDYPMINLAKEAA